MKIAAEKVVDFDERRSADQAAKDLAPVLSEDYVALWNLSVATSTRCASIGPGGIGTSGTATGGSVIKWPSHRPGHSVLSAHLRAPDQSPADRRRLGSRKFAEGVEGFARSDQRIAVTHNRWDQDVEALGTPSGIVDLRTGEMFDPDPELFITRSTAVDPSNITDCLRWLQFIHQITGGDPTLKKFLQQWSGYCLTGATSEQKLVFIHGPGGTGKSTFATTLLKIMTEHYATSAAMETFTDSRYDQHPEQVARLTGMRMVIATRPRPDTSGAKIASST